MRFIRRYGRAAIVVRAPGDSTQSSNQPHPQEPLETKATPPPRTSNLDATSPKKNPGQRLMEHVPSYVWQPDILSAPTGMYPESRYPDPRPDAASSSTTLAAPQDAPWAASPEEPLARPPEEPMGANAPQEHMAPTDHGGHLPGSHETTDVYPDEMRSIMGGFIQHRLYPLLHPTT